MSNNFLVVGGIKNDDEDESLFASAVFPLTNEMNSIVTNILASIKNGIESKPFNAIPIETTTVQYASVVPSVVPSVLPTVPTAPPMPVVVEDSASAVGSSMIVTDETTTDAQYAPATTISNTESIVEPEPTTTIVQKPVTTPNEPASDLFTNTIESFSFPTNNIAIDWTILIIAVIILVLLGNYLWANYL